MLLKPIKIGSLKLKNNIFIAPLAGYTNLPSRRIYREQKPGIIYTEMVSSMGLKYSYDKSVKLLDTVNNDKPLGLQLFGPDAESILNAYLLISKKRFDLIDINCGCSVRKILKGESGAVLLKYPGKIYNIIKKLKESTRKPVTVKIRSGWDELNINYMNVFEAALKGGIDAVVFHPRTRSMMFKGKADWKQIKELKKISPVPIIGNGDIFTADDARMMFEETGCDGIMLARGLIENPFLIEEIIMSLNGKKYILPDLKKRFYIMRKHLIFMIKYFGERTGVIEFRKFIRGYIKGLPNVSKLRKILSRVEDKKSFNEALNDYLIYVNELN